MNIRTLSATLLIVVGLGLAGWQAMERFSFASGSRIWVEGTSTVHDWSCDADQISATLDATTGDAALTGLSALTVTIPVAGMDCDNGTMNGKLRDALGTSPIRFTLSNARVASPNGGRFVVEANGQLTIHGTSRAQRVTAQGQVLGNGRYRFTGSVPVTMSQFGVDPPTAMLGTLRTGDRVTVRFDVTATR
jgi:polyisoprenoid-binding protein YceI